MWNTVKIYWADVSSVTMPYMRYSMWQALMRNPKDCTPYCRLSNSNIKELSVFWLQQSLRVKKCTNYFASLFTRTHAHTHARTQTRTHAHMYSCITTSPQSNAGLLTNTWLHFYSMRLPFARPRLHSTSVPGQSAKPVVSGQTGILPPDRSTSKRGWKRCHVGWRPTKLQSLKHDERNWVSSFTTWSEFPCSANQHPESAIKKKPTNLCALLNFSKNESHVW